MPQEFQILRCYSCEKFQVHQTKKAKKWQCKVCGEKQSLKKAYFLGSAKDCRTNVQQLNFEDGQRKLELLQNGDSFDENTETTTGSNEVYECENFPDESTDNGWNNAFPCENDESPPCMPKKKLKYSEDPLSEILNEVSSYSDFVQHEDSVVVQKTTSKTSYRETSISFNVSFGDNSDASHRNDSIESNEDPSKVNNEKKLQVSSTPDKPVVKCKNPKNRGFQLIMNAAKKLSVHNEQI